MEDMKTSGLKQRRLREMLKFFYRNWTELAGGAEDDDGWLIPGEEADVHALLKDVLHFTGGILEPEASAMAVRFLLACPEVLASAQRAHVLVDDYQMHSRASQHLANLLARDSVIVAADPAAVVEVFDSYPYGEGIGEFTQANEGCERIVLNESYACAAAARAASRLRASLDAGAAPLGDAEAESDAPSPSQSASSATSGTTATPTVPDRAAIAASFPALKATDPAAEMASVADAVQTALEAGADPSSIYVLAFHPAWERRVARVLEARGIATATPVRGRVAAGDYRDLDRCAAARLLTALALVANAHDALAWRAWCGFGDYLANSAVFADMRAEADEQGKDLVAMLDEVAAAAPEEGFPGTGIGRVLDAYRTGRTLIEQAQGLEGDELIGALASALNLTGENGEHAMQLVRAPTAQACCIHFRHLFRCERARARTVKRRRANLFRNGYRCAERRPNPDRSSPKPYERPRLRSRRRLRACRRQRAPDRPRARHAGARRLHKRLLPHARLLRRHRNHPGQAEARPCYRHATPLRRRRQSDTAPDRQLVHLYKPRGSRNTQAGDRPRKASSRRAHRRHHPEHLPSRNRSRR